MEAFSNWWNELSVILKIYWCIAVPFTIFFLLELFISFVGGDTPDDLPDSEIDHDHGIGFQFLTLKNMVGFFTIFSWTGIACIKAGLPLGWTLIISTIAGLAMMAIMAGLFFLLMKAGANGTLRMEKAIGQTGAVYLTIQSKRKSIGKVQVKVMGALRTLDAITDDGQDLPTGKIISVSNIVNDNLLLVTSK
jgi:membrane protein implicated in regulation of membrane protease activity